MLCTTTTQGETCARCGLVMPVSGVPRNCRPGLGDMVAAGLSAVGITKERVQAVVGGPCGCEERQKSLNQLGYSLGIGTPGRES